MTKLSERNLKSKTPKVYTTKSEENLQLQNPSRKAKKNPQSTDNGSSKTEQLNQQQWKSIAFLVDKICLVLFTFVEVILVVILCIQNVK